MLTRSDRLLALSLICLCSGVAVSALYWWGIQYAAAAVLTVLFTALYIVALAEIRR